MSIKNVDLAGDWWILSQISVKNVDLAGYHLISSQMSVKKKYILNISEQWGGARDRLACLDSSVSVAVTG
jgi:hypothetical protein